MFTKLQQWLSAIFLYASFWLSSFYDKLPLTLSDPWKEIIFASPIYFLITFACFSLATIGYRVAIFNDCTEASEELKKEIIEAKKDLEKKGLKIS
ncbi:hypothetical protein CAPTEDRAFT_180320 [Capitella teleta]|uniref:Dolichol-phosphate mannosyltransferase subunit 3 n=1 Tax=Capitella teleta TaxID=283909 RepID=R7TNY7_CAPTE|nr:hypothetical protein CAPTEDRAFT_180320 [Capitella teleta]|eukprot:ELT95608.1 hypothetical protein CAPTEDRAFT_180320 [Capitella teleta]